MKEDRPRAIVMTCYSASHQLNRLIVRGSDGHTRTNWMSGDDPSPAGARSPADEQLPYRLRDDFLSAAELSFFRVLVGVVRDKAIICPKVRLADLFFVARPHENQSSRNKVDRKHVDFLLCNPATLHPLLGIELDDSSHARSARQERDQFVDDVFEVAGLPLLRIPARSTYSPHELLGLIVPHLSNCADSRPNQRIPETDPLPICSKCNLPMVRRVSSKGQHVGQSFWGCPNYPKCRVTVQD